MDPFKFEKKWFFKPRETNFKETLKKRVAIDKIIEYYMCTFFR